MPSYRSVICKKCGALKLPVFGCQNETCAAYGAYRKRQPKLQSTQTMVLALKQKKRDKRLAYLRSYNANFAKRSKKQRHIQFRLLQIAIGRLLNTLERDRTGQWVLYEDRLAEFQIQAKAASKLYNESIKYFPVPKSMMNEYQNVLISLRSSRS